MIAIPCTNCTHMIDIDTQVEPIKVPLYLLVNSVLCQSCQIESKNNERDKKLNKVLRRGLIERVKEWCNV